MIVLPILMNIVYNIFLSINSYYIYKNLWLVGGIPTPLRNMKVHGKDYPNGN